MAAPELHQRRVFAAAIFAGLRKGELCGLQEPDVDLSRRMLVARRSYARPFPKSRKQRVVRLLGHSEPEDHGAALRAPAPDFMAAPPDSGTIPASLTGGV